jgi:hypothetical protein
MRIDSRLMKTEMELGVIERQDDRLLMKGPPDDWNNTKVYLSPQDVVTTVRLSLHPGMLGYVLLFPFFYLAHQLRCQRDIRPVVYNVGYIVAALFMALLLVGGIPFMLARPITATIVVGVLALLFLSVVVGSGKLAFLYLAVPLGVLAELLFAAGRGVAAADLPKLAVVVVVTLLVLGKALGGLRQGQVANPLYRTGYLVILIFTLVIAFNLPAYLRDDPWGASLPLLAFAGFHFVRYLDTRQVRQQYLAMLFLGAGFLAGLYGIPALPRAYYGLPLIALSMAMILVADRYHEAHGLAHVAPAYSVAILIALAAFAYAWRDLPALLLSLALFSVHFFGGTRSLRDKSTAADAGETAFQWIEFALANLAAGLAALLMLSVGRASWAAVIAAPVYVHFYRKMALGRETTLLQTRNQYLWAAGAFYGLTVFVVLGLLDPLRSPQNDMLLVPPLMVPLLLYGRRLQRQAKASLAASIYESSLVTVAASLALPAVLGQAYLPTAAAVAGLWLALYLLLAALWRDETLLYPLPLALAQLYSAGLVAAGIGPTSRGLLFAAVGLAAMLAALWLQRRSRGPARALCVAWFVFSGASIWEAAPDRLALTYLIAVWAAAYVLAASFVRQPPAEAGTAEAEGYA